MVLIEQLFSSYALDLSLSDRLELSNICSYCCPISGTKDCRYRLGDIFQQWTDSVIL